MTKADDQVGGGAVCWTAMHDDRTRMCSLASQTEENYADVILITFMIRVKEGGGID